MSDRRLKDVLAYPRFKRGIRVLVLDSGYLVVRDAIDAAQDLGWQVFTLALPTLEQGTSQFIAELLSALVLHQPDFILTINHLGFDEDGVLAQLLHRYEIPTATWFVDHPLPILGGAAENATPHVRVFCFERSAIPWLEAQGYVEPVYLPTASNARYFQPDRIQRALLWELQGPLTFAGNSWWTKARVEPVSWVQRAAQQLQAQHGFDRQFVARDLLHLAADLVLPGRRGRRDPYLAIAVALAESSMETRGRFARALQPLGLRIHGDNHWQRLAPGIEVRPFLPYATALPALFVASQINANVTAEQMPTAVNQRVWDVPAVGGFLLTDAQEDTLEFFTEDEEVVVYRSFAEAADKASFYLKHPERAAAIAARAQQKIDRFHRFTHRLLRLGELMRAQFA